MLRQENDGLPTYQFESLADEALTHATFTRLGGISQGPFATLNVGNSVGDDESAVAENHRRIYAHLSLDSGCVSSPYQVHGNRIAVVTTQSSGEVFATTDGLVTNVTGAALLLRFADCQPILLYDPEHHALGLVHAGWRGVALNIARRAIETMQKAFGTNPQAVMAGLGPAIGPCCYTVGDRVASALGYVLPDWNKAMEADGESWRLDLSAANAQLLAEAGVRNVERADICTSCKNNEFFSHRAEQGKTGRFAVIALLQPRIQKELGANTLPSQPSTDIQDGPSTESLNPPGFPSFGEFLRGEE